MGTYEGQLKSIETKLALLQFTDEETANIIEKAQLSSLERQRKIVEKKVDEVHNLKVEIQEAKIQRGKKKQTTSKDGPEKSTLHYRNSSILYRKWRRSQKKSSANN